MRYAALVTYSDSSDLDARRSRTRVRTEVTEPEKKALLAFLRTL